jgi:hypothetical protein
MAVVLVMRNPGWHTSARILIGRGLRNTSIRVSVTAGERQRSGKRFPLRALSRIFSPADGGFCLESS